MSAALSFFSGCSFAQPSGFGSAHLNRKAFHFNCPLSIINYQLPHSLCPKSRYACGCPLFFPRRVTLLSLLSASQATLRSRSSVAVRLPQPRHCAPHPQKNVPCPKKGTTFFAPCGAWGGLFPPPHNLTHNVDSGAIPIPKKNKKKKEKFSSGFKK